MDAIGSFGVRPPKTLHGIPQKAERKRLKNVRLTTVQTNCSGRHALKNNWSELLWPASLSRNNFFWGFNMADEGYNESRRVNAGCYFNSRVARLRKREK